MFKVSEVKRTTICLSCRGPIAPKELQVSFGKYFQHLQCLPTLRPLTLDMFWSSPELSPAGARRLAAFVKGMSATVLNSGSTDHETFEGNAAKDHPNGDSGLVLRLRIPPGVFYSDLIEEGEHSAGWPIEASEEERLHHGGYRPGAFLPAYAPEDSIVDVSSQQASDQHESYQDWNPDIARWMETTLQTNPTTPSPSHATSAASRAAPTLATLPSHQRPHTAMSWPPSLSSLASVHQQLIASHAPSPSAHRAPEGGSVSGVSKRNDGETAHNQDFSLTPLPSQPPQDLSPNTSLTSSVVAVSSNYTKEIPSVPSQSPVGHKTTIAVSSYSRHRNALMSPRSEAANRIGPDTTSKPILSSFDTYRNQSEATDHGSWSTGPPLRKDFSHEGVTESNLVASTPRMALPEPPVGMPILTPVELVSFPAWTVSGRTFKLVDESLSSFSSVSSFASPAYLISSTTASSMPQPIPPRTNGSSVTSATPTTTISLSSTSAPGATTGATSTTSGLGFLTSRDGVAPGEARQSSRFAYNSTSVSSLPGTSPSSFSTLSSKHCIDSISSLSPPTQIYHQSPNSIRISKFVAIQPGRTSLSFLFNPPPETTKVMVLSALVESDALNTPLVPYKRERAHMNIPYHVLVNIFSFASLGDIYAWSQVSQDWALAARSSELWKPKCEREISPVFIQRLLPRIAPSLSNDAYMLVYRWHNPPLTISQAPCKVCGSDAAQRCANVFVCSSCKKSDEYAVTTKRQLTLQYHMSSIDVQEYLPASLQNCNSLVRSDIMLAIAKKRRTMISGQLRRARLSDHHKYHLFFNSLVRRKTVDSDEEELQIAADLVRDFKKLLIEEAKLWVQHNPEFHRSWAIACQNEQGVVLSPIPGTSPTSTMQMSNDFPTTSNQSTSPRSSSSHSNYGQNESSAMVVDEEPAEPSSLPEFQPFRYPTSVYNHGQPILAPTTPLHTSQHLEDPYYDHPRNYHLHRQPHAAQEPQDHMDDQTSYNYAYGNSSETPQVDYQQDLIGNYLLLGYKTTWSQPVKSSEPMQPAPPHSTVHHSIHTTSYHPAINGQTMAYMGARHQSETRIFGDPFSAPTSWSQPVPHAMLSPTSPTQAAVLHPSQPSHSKHS